MRHIFFWKTPLSSLLSVSAYASPNLVPRGEERFVVSPRRPMELAGLIATSRGVRGRKSSMTWFAGRAGASLRSPSERVSYQDPSKYRSASLP